MTSSKEPNATQITGQIEGDTEELRSKTISDFGSQWTYFTENTGYYASDEFFTDLIEPLLSAEDFKGASCAEIGAGTGNIAAMILRSGASHLTAVEPSAAVGPLRENLADFADRVTVAHTMGENIPKSDFDLILSIGVLHHIPQPDPVVKAAYDALKPGGRMFIWLYGKEGNAAYLTIVLPIRALTRRFPIPVLNGLAYGFDALLMPLVFLARRGIKVPLHDYLRDVYGKLSGADRRLVVVDQLKPEWALYYSEKDARDLLERNGFKNVELHHRSGYSWSVLGEKQGDEPDPSAPDNA